MKSKVIVRFFVYGIVIAALTILIAYHGSVQDRIVLEEGKTLLLRNDAERAHEKFHSILNSSSVGKEAEIGEVLTAILIDGQTFLEQTTLDSSVDIEDFGLSLLMWKQLRSGDFEKLLLLTKLGNLYRRESANTFRVAALIEAGRWEEASSLAESISLSSMKSQLAYRITEAVQYHDADIRHILWDRNGEIIGVIRPDRSLDLVDDNYRDYLQPAYLRAIDLSTAPFSIYMSIDLDLSRRARKLFGSNQGSIVVLEPETGEVLVAVSDDTTHKRMGEGSSPAFEQQLEPASISKLITTVAAYRAEIDPDEFISKINSRPAKRYVGGILYNPAQLGKLRGLNQAMAGSCNIAFADLGIAVGWKGMVNELRSFGFDQSAGNPFPLGHVLQWIGNERELADLSIGLEQTEMTPVHGAMISSVFGNDGLFMKPAFIHAGDGYLGYSIDDVVKSAGKKVVEDDWLPEIISSMEAVTGWGGTASRVAPYDFPVAMKTGTGGTYQQGFHINYIGFAPVDTPQFAFAVRVTRKWQSNKARRTGYAVTRELIKLLRQASPRY